MGQVVTSSSVLTAFELKEHSWKMIKLYEEIDSVQKELDKIERPKLKKLHPKPSLTYDWAEGEVKRKKKKAIRSFLLLSLLIFGAIFALYHSDFPYINDNNVIDVFGFAIMACIVLLILCIVRCCSCNALHVLAKARKKLNSRNSVNAKNKKIIEENNRIKGEWEKENSVIINKLNLLKKKAAPYSELYSIWNKCVNEVRRDHHISNWERDLNSDNLFVIRYMLQVFVWSDWPQEPMKILDIVSMAKERWVANKNRYYAEMK